MPVAAPISARRREHVPARLQRGRLGLARNAGSALVAAVLRWLARGSAIACGSVIPRSMRSVSICRTVVMIVEPPGDPTVSHGLPRRSTIVGLIELRGRLPPWTRLGCVSES